MTIDTIELSENDAMPVSLLLFEIGLDKFSYNTSDVNIIKDGVVYTPNDTLVTGNVEANAENKNSALSITTDISFEIAQLFLSDTPHTEIKLTIFLGHIGDSEYRVIWKGKVANVNRVENNQANISCEQNISVLFRGGLTYRFGSLCQHSVYQGGCNLDFDLNSSDVTVNTVAGQVVTSDDFLSVPSGHYATGVALFEGKHYRMVFTHVGNTITLSRPIPGLGNGDILKVAAGCNKTVARCKELNNFDNHLSFNTIPERNPFNGLSSKSNAAPISIGTLGTWTRV